MESPEGKAETFDDTVDRLTMYTIATVSQTPGFSNNLWLHHHGSNGNDVFYIEKVASKAIYPDSIPISGVLETRRWISERIKRFTASRHGEPMHYAGRPMCDICASPVAVDFLVPDLVWEEVTKRLRTETLCISCFARLGDEALVAWERNISFTPCSKFTHMRISDDLAEIVSAANRQAREGDTR